MWLNCLKCAHLFVFITYIHTSKSPLPSLRPGRLVRFASALPALIHAPRSTLHAFVYTALMMINMSGRYPATWPDQVFSVFIISRTEPIGHTSPMRANIINIPHFISIERCCWCLLQLAGATCAPCLPFSSPIHDKFLSSATSAPHSPRGPRTLGAPIETADHGRATLSMPAHQSSPTDGLSSWKRSVQRVGIPNCGSSWLSCDPKVALCAVDWRLVVIGASISLSATMTSGARPARRQCPARLQASLS